MAKTEWEDALIAHGILPPEEKPEDEEEENVGSKVPPLPRVDSSSSLDSLESDFENEYRRKRLEELKGLNKTTGYGGTVYPVSRQDYSREVTEESQKEGTDGVIIHLYKDGIVASHILKSYLEELAQVHPNTKFCAIQADRCIENYPDRNVPTLLAYKGGQMVVQAVAWGRAVDWSVTGPGQETERDGHSLSDLERFLAIKEIVHVKER